MKEHDEVVLEKIRYAVSSALKRTDLKVELIESSLDWLVVQIRGYNYGERLERKEVIRYPASLRDHLKLRLPMWMQKRWPPKYRRIMADCAVLYPDFHPNLEGEPWIIRIIKTTMEPC